MRNSQYKQLEKNRWNIKYIKSLKDIHVRNKFTNRK